MKSLWWEASRHKKLIPLANKEKTFEQQLPVFFFTNTLAYTFLVSVSPGIEKFLQNVVLFFRKLSYSVFLKSKRWELLSQWQTSEVYFAPYVMKTYDIYKKNHKLREYTQVLSKMLFFSNSNSCESKICLKEKKPNTYIRLWDNIFQKITYMYLKSFNQSFNIELRENSVVLG